VALPTALVPIVFHTNSVIGFLIPEARTPSNYGREEYRSAVADVHALTRRHGASLAHVLSLFIVDDRIHPCSCRQNYDKKTARNGLFSVSQPSYKSVFFGRVRRKITYTAMRGVIVPAPPCGPRIFLGIEGQPMESISVQLNACWRASSLSSRLPSALLLHEN
jgi:hypothetical protein